jgi:hypothetical protein
MVMVVTVAIVDGIRASAGAAAAPPFDFALLVLFLWELLSSAFFARAIGTYSFLYPRSLPGWENVWIQTSFEEAFRVPNIPNFGSHGRRARAKNDRNHAGGN